MLECYKSDNSCELLKELEKSLDNLFLTYVKYKNVILILDEIFWDFFVEVKRKINSISNLEEFCSKCEMDKILLKLDNFRLVERIISSEV